MEPNTRPPNDRDANLVIVETKEKIVKALNEANLPIGVLALIMREMARETSDQERLAVATLKQAAIAASPQAGDKQPGA